MLKTLEGKAGRVQRARDRSFVYASGDATNTSDYKVEQALLHPRYEIRMLSLGRGDAQPVGGAV